MHLFLNFSVGYFIPNLKGELLCFLKDEWAFLIGWAGVASWRGSRQEVACEHL